MAPAGDGQLARVIGTKFPIAGAVLELLGPEVVAAIKGGKPEDIEDAVKRNPETINNLNLEKPLQSGVTITSIGGLIGGLMVLGGLYLVNGSVSEEAVGVYVMAAIGFAGTVYRRWAPGLSPLGWFRKK